MDIASASHHQRNPEGAPDSSHAIARRADQLRGEGRFAEAIEACLKELEVHPTYIGARMVLGRSYLEQGDQPNAEKQFRRILELEPDNVRACVHLGQMCEAQGRTDDAITYYEAAHEWAPFDRETNEGLIRLRASTSSSDLAHSETKKRDAVLDRSLDASASDPLQEAGELFATETLADLYASQGLFDRAGAIYRHLLANDPTREGIRAKLEALEEAPAASVAVQPDDADQGLPPTPSALRWPSSSATAVLAESSGTEERAFSRGAALTIAKSPEQKRLEELERWLEGVRRYRCTETATGR